MTELTCTQLGLHRAVVRPKVSRLSVQSRYGIYRFREMRKRVLQNPLLEGCFVRVTINRSGVQVGCSHVSRSLQPCELHVAVRFDFVRTVLRRRM